jgi:hypothetical protein
VISKEEYKTLVGESGPNGKDESENDPAKDQPTTAEDKSQADTNKQSNLTEVGAQRKRKQVKVVGEDKAEAEEVQPKPTKKTKKAKKIKLSFDEE